MVPLKYLSNFWGNLEISLTNYEINFSLTWSEDYVTASNTAADEQTKFAIVDKKLYVPVVTLSTRDNLRLLQQFKLRFKGNVNWNKYQSKVTLQNRKRYLDYLIDPSFQGVKRLFVLSFENNTHQITHTRCFLQTVEIKF